MVNDKANEDQEDQLRPRCRPIKIVFADQHTKGEVVSYLQMVVNVARMRKFKWMFFQSDLTWKQRGEARERMSRRLEDRRHTGGGELC